MRVALPERSALRQVVELAIRVEQFKRVFILGTFGCDRGAAMQRRRNIQ